MNIETFNKNSEIAIAVKYDAVDFTKTPVDSTGKIVLHEAYGKLLAAITQHGMQPTGAPYCKYTNGSEDFMRFDIELGIPVSEPLPEQDGMYMATTDEGKAISAVHKGAYKDISNTYAVLQTYLAENKLESTGVYYDYYISDPRDTAENELLTKIVFMV